MSTDSALEVVAVDRIDRNEILVEFSDSTSASYSPDELAALRPFREKTDEPQPRK